MTKKMKIVNESQGETLVESAKWCDSFGSKLRGFMFKSSLETHEGLVLVEGRDSKLQTSIHMLFVSFDLGVIWVNSAGVVVDTVVAKSWALNYAPQEAARYVIEMHPDLLSQVKIGDRIVFEAVA